MTRLRTLESVPTFSEVIRIALREYWITTAEEFVSTAVAGNHEFGSGLAALSCALNMSEETVVALVEAAQAALPPNMSFPAEAELVAGTGAIFDDLQPLTDTPFDLPIDLPTEKSLANSLVPPRNQGGRNTCVAFALAAMVEQSTGQADLLSPQFIYWACKQTDSLPGDVGTYPDVGMAVLQQRGVCREATWAYNPLRMDTNPGHGPPPSNAEMEASSRRAAGVTQLPPGDILRIKASIANGYSVMLALPISEHWTNTWQARSLGRVRRPLPGEKQLGGHAILAVGYHDDKTAPGGGYLIIRNSWGLDWGRENDAGAGYGHIPYQLIAEHNRVAFTITGMAAPSMYAATTGSVMASTENALVDTANASVPAGLLQLAQDLAVQTAHDLAQLESVLQDLRQALHLPANVIQTSLTASSGAQLPAEPARGWSGPLILVREKQAGLQELLTPNGILATTGQPLLTIDTDSASSLARASAPAKKEDTAEYHLHRARVASEEAHAGTVFGDENNIQQAGWALVVNADDDVALLRALSPLIAKRCMDQGLGVPLLQFRTGETCGAWLARTVPNPNAPLKSGLPVLVHRPGEGAAAFLARHGVSQGPVDPRRGVPFYLLLAGRPGPIASNDTAYLPYLLQYELDIFWGVGRLCFTDSHSGQHNYAAYATYAERVVAVEQSVTPPYTKHIAYFGTRHAFDTATIRSADELVTPLVEGHSGQPGVAAIPGFSQQAFLGQQATRDTLDRILRGQTEGGRPALLFTATHGIGFPVDDARLLTDQGALICQEWTGFGSIRREHWYTGADLPANIQVDGLIAVCFACYSTGCPAEDQFVFEPGKHRPVIAPYPVVTQLPQQLLARGALAVLGHVDRAWTHSFSAPGVPAQTQRFESVLGRLMRGDRLGLATDQFNMVQGALAAQLAQRLEDIRFGYQMTSSELSSLWVARNDARNYGVLGDPAVRLPFT